MYGHYNADSNAIEYFDIDDNNVDIETGLHLHCQLLQSFENDKQHNPKDRFAGFAASDTTPSDRLLFDAQNNNGEIMRDNDLLHNNCNQCSNLCTNNSSNTDETEKPFHEIAAHSVSPQSHQPVLVPVRKMSRTRQMLDDTSSKPTPTKSKSKTTPTSEANATKRYNVVIGQFQRSLIEVYH